MNQRFDPPRAGTLQNFESVAAEDAEDRITTRLKRGQASAVEQGEPLPLQRLLGSAEAARATGGEDDRAGSQTGCGCG